MKIPAGLWLVQLSSGVGPLKSLLRSNDEEAQGRSPDERSDIRGVAPHIAPLMRATMLSFKNDVVTLIRDAERSRACTHKSKFESELDPCPLSGVLQTQTGHRLRSEKCQKATLPTTSRLCLGYSLAIDVSEASGTSNAYTKPLGSYVNRTSPLSCLPSVSISLVPKLRFSGA
jgi:hypothetical protein